jgi:hypothetical protein
MIIKKFLEYISESYLLGGRGPLYHFTSSLSYIIKSDSLEVHKPAHSSHGKEKSISLTRNILYFEYTICGLHDCIIKLDTDKLIIDGYMPYPVDEIAWLDGEPNINIIKNYSFGKSNFSAIKQGKRSLKHNLDLPIHNDDKLGIEYEERIYKNINNLGKYIISISIVGNYNEEDYLNDYLKKYPHIKIYSIPDINNVLKQVDITKYFEQ